ncbi:MAG: Tad domain-containing protein [Chloroflexi bacterium]|nr:Tad domain-containing protein [Chloroflexota bacterium]
MKHNKSEKGQAIILIVVAIMGLLVLTALAVDGGMAYSERRQAQTSADSAALDAGLAKVRGGDLATLVTEGMARAASNGFDNNGTDNIITINNPPQDGCNGPSLYAGNDEYIQVIIRTVTKTYFGGVVGVNEVSNCVDAVARAVPGTTAEMVYGNAVVSLAPSGCNRMWAHGNPDIDVVGGGIFTNSADPSCAFLQNGSGSITAPSITVVGGASYSNGHVSPTPTTGAAAVPYPPFVLPNPTCSGTAQKSGNTLSPGTVNGNFPPNGVDALNPGIYCVTGDFDLHGNATLTGSEVLIVMLNGTVTWNGNSTANLSGPTSGPFKGLLLYQPITNTNVVTINGTTSMQLTGSILAPGATVRLLGTGDVNSFNSQVIGYEVEFGGTGNGTIRYDDDDNFDAAIPPQLELVE